MVKPIVIYSLPRTKSTAVLQACKRKNKIFEPFNAFSVFDIRYDLPPEESLTAYKDAVQDIQCFYASYAIEKLSEIKKRELFISLNEGDVAFKVLPQQLFNFLEGRLWFENWDKDKTHTIYVLVRNLKDQMWSHLLANYFGYFEEVAVEPFYIEIEGNLFRELRNNLDSFIRFFPKNGILIDFENLPTPDFDISQIQIKEQHSMEKKKYVKNYIECENHINNLILYYNKSYYNALLGAKS